MIKRHFSRQAILSQSTWSKTAQEVAASKYLRKRDGETSVTQMFQRVVSAICQAGELQGYFSGEQTRIFADELTYLLQQQMGSFNSPVYFNVGVFPSYGVAGTADNYAWDEASQRALPTPAAYVRPQASACFIQDVQDDLLSIFDLLKSEAKLFKYGSGTGTNFSRLRARGEPLDSGGETTGLIPYLEIFDKAAQAIKSGGTTRRAAKMVVLDADHPEVMEFIAWKMNEERKARVLLANGYSGGMDGEAFRTVSGQNSNNSIRMTDDFLRRVENNESWQLLTRRGGRPIRELPAQEIFKHVARAAWECADPGAQFHDTIQKWHMCANSGPIHSSNPCSEFMFLDDSACNLASLNLVSFLTTDGDLDWSLFTQAAEIFLLAQDILVDYASYPTLAISENSHRFRPLGLGYANLGGLLMRLGIPYESEEAKQWTTNITGALHAVALRASQKIAEKKGTFAAWKENESSAMHVLNLHHQAWKKSGGNLPWVDNLYREVISGKGLRNAQVTLIAPTGTIGLLMDCDTLGIEPDFALIKRKQLAGGGDLVLINQAVAPALTRLGYTTGQTQEMLIYLRTHGHLVGAPGLKHDAVFDCALPPQGHPERRISPHGHLQIMAAAQPFLSGAISKTVNLPASFTVAETEKLFLDAWKLGLKSLAIYRDGSKALQPLCAEC